MNKAELVIYENLTDSLDISLNFIFYGADKNDPEGKFIIDIVKDGKSQVECDHPFFTIEQAKLIVSFLQSIIDS